jgi:hypothetical protein
MFGKRNYFVFLGSAAALLSMVCPLHTRKEPPEKSLRLSSRLIVALYVLNKYSHSFP